REALVANFTQPAGALAALQNDWYISNWLIPQGDNIDINYTPDNVFQHNDALGIKASGVSCDLLLLFGMTAHARRQYSGSGPVNSGEVYTLREDIRHGTFRMRAVVPTVPGVVFGFFTYISGTQEQDIEFLSSDTDYYQRVHYTNQPGLLDGDVDPNASKTVVVSGADFTAFGEHRIDWLPTSTNYFYNQVQKTSITKNVPNTPSRIILNVWSNGDPLFSKGPPTADAIATIQWVQLYFNSTSLDEAAFRTACTAAGNTLPIFNHIRNTKTAATSSAAEMRRVIPITIQPAVTNGAPNIRPEVCVEPGSGRNWSEKSRFECLRRKYAMTISRPASTAYKIPTRKAKGIRGGER
ncbi:hypothetical protein FRC17_008297, partial [Serendipita sp. 399]